MSQSVHTRFCCNNKQLNSMSVLETKMCSCFWCMPIRCWLGGSTSYSSWWNWWWRRTEFWKVSPWQLKVPAQKRPIPHLLIFHWPELVKWLHKEHGCQIVQIWPHSWKPASQKCWWGALKPTVDTYIKKQTSS